MVFQHVYRICITFEADYDTIIHHLYMNRKTNSGPTGTFKFNPRYPA